MINYSSQNQISLEFFKHPFKTELDPENRWVKLANVIPWDELAGVYSKKLQTDRGRKSVDIRTVIAALIVKHKLRLDDRGTIAMIQENIYLQYFCGLKQFTIEPVFDASLFVDIRKRLGVKEFNKFNKIIIEQAERMKPHQARIKKVKSKKQKEDDSHNEDKGTQKPSTKNRGTQKVDASVADQEIKYPNDVELLNDAREHLERMIDVLYDEKIDKKKPRTYRRVAHDEYLSFSKKRKKSKKEIRKALKAQLQYIKRDIKTIDKMLATTERSNKLSPKDISLLEVIKEVYRQQQEMYDNKTHRISNRIISLHQPWVRPIVRGKNGRKVEFGSKINISEVNGFCWIDQLKWDAYNEGSYLEQQVEDYKEIFGCYPKLLLADTIYLTRANIKMLKNKGIECHGKQLGRPPKKPKETYSQRYYKRKKQAKRNHVEGKFGQAKRGYGLNNIKARLAQTSESWISSIIFVMNLIKLLEIAEKYGRFFIQILKTVIFAFKYSYFREKFSNQISFFTQSQIFSPKVVG